MGPYVVIVTGDIGVGPQVVESRDRGKGVALEVEVDVERVLLGHSQQARGLRLGTDDHEVVRAGLG